MKNLKKISLILFMAIMSIPAFSQQEDFDKTLKDAEAGNTEAMYNLGDLYTKEYDMSKAYYWYEKAANKGHIEAILMTGQKYLAATDYLQAFNWFSKAIEKGDSRAMYLVGFMYENGLGTTKNKSKAEEWYKSAESIDTDGMLIIAIYYNNGFGVPIDMSKGKYWLNKACEMGNKDACAALKELGGNLKKSTIAWIKEKLAKYGGSTEYYEGMIFGTYYEEVVVTPCKISYKVYSASEYDSGSLESSVSFNPSLIKEWKVNADKDGIYTDAKVIEETTYKYDGTIEKKSFVNSISINGDILEDMIEKLSILATFCEK